MYRSVQQPSSDRDSSRPPRRHDGHPRENQNYQGNPDRRAHQEDGRYYYDEGQNQEDNHDLRDYSDSSSYRTQSTTGSALRVPLPPISGRRHNYQDSPYGFMQEQPATLSTLEDSEIPEEGYLYLEDAFICYFIHHYDYLEVRQLGELWNFYIAEEELGIPLEVEAYDIIRSRYWFLHQRAHHMVKELPEWASASAEDVNCAAVESLARACERTCMGSRPYRWTRPYLVEEDWAHDSYMSRLRYSSSYTYPNLSTRDGFPSRLQVDRN
ncbi:hypothetical protein MMC27_006893 [Xylographa pallens]|nr:hypothetical protein [Xylographa pallens]